MPSGLKQEPRSGRGGAWSSGDSQPSQRVNLVRPFYDRLRAARWRVRRLSRGPRGLGVPAAWVKHSPRLERRCKHEKPQMTLERERVVSQFEFACPSRIDRSRITSADQELAPLIQCPAGRFNRNQPPKIGSRRCEIDLSSRAKLLRLEEGLCDARADCTRQNLDDLLDWRKAIAATHRPAIRQWEVSASPLAPSMFYGTFRRLLRKGIALHERYWLTRTLKLPPHASLPIYTRFVGSSRASVIVVSHLALSIQSEGGGGSHTTLRTVEAFSTPPLPWESSYEQAEENPLGSPTTFAPSGDVRGHRARCFRPNGTALRDYTPPLV